MHEAINEIDAQKCTEKIVYVLDTAVRHLLLRVEIVYQEPQIQKGNKSSSQVLSCLLASFLN